MTPPTEEPDSADPTGGIGRFRLASYLGALMAMLALYRLGLGMWGGRHAWSAAALFAACLVVMADVRQARTDQWLAAWTVIAMGALWQIIRPGGAGRPGLAAAVFWIALAMGILTKGPVCPLVCGGAVAALAVVTPDRSWLGRLRFGWGAMIVVALVGAWLVPLGVLVGPEQVARAFVDEVLWRAAAPKEGHFAPPGYHLLLLPILFWPGSLALIPAAWHALSAVAGPPGKREDAAAEAGLRGRMVAFFRSARARCAAAGVTPELFCLAWIAPAWLAFELSMTKLPHYTLPLYPAVALLCARGLAAGSTGWEPFLRYRAAGPLIWAWVALSCLLSLGILGASVWLLRPVPGWSGWAATAACALSSVVLIGGIVQALRRHLFERMQTRALLLAAITLPVVLGVVMPTSQVLWISSRLMREIKRIDPAGARPLATVSYHEDSLVYLTGGRVERLRWREVIDWMDRHPQGLLIMPEVLLPRGRRVQRLATVEGWNLGAGLYEQLMIAQPTCGGGSSSAAAGGEGAAPAGSAR